MWLGQVLLIPRNMNMFVGSYCYDLKIVKIANKSLANINEFTVVRIYLDLDGCYMQIASTSSIRATCFDTG